MDVPGKGPVFFLVNFSNGTILIAMKVAIIGAGQVGSATAFALAMERFVSQVVLIDANGDRALAEATDIGHAVPFGHPEWILSGNYGDIADAGIVIITAGANQKPGQTRLDLLAANVAIFKKIIPQVVAHAPQAILLVATNPIDVIGEISLRLSQFPRHRVIGSGTALDSARFRIEIAKFLGLSAQSVQGSVIGEHGDSCVPVWSNVTVESIPLEDMAKKLGKNLDDSVRATIHGNVRDAAYNIIRGKGATYYGIGGTLSRICRHIILDERCTAMLSTHHDSVEGVEDISISTPVIVGRMGIERVLPMDLNGEERLAFVKSAAILREATRSAQAML
jgi:L-lactate dehydrogenase